MQTDRQTDRQAHWLADCGADTYCSATFYMSLLQFVDMSGVGAVVLYCCIVVAYGIQTYFEKISSIWTKCGSLR